MSTPRRSSEEMEQLRERLSPRDWKALVEREQSRVTADDDRKIIQLLRARHGLLTRIRLVDGTVLDVSNIAEGYDIGDPYAHVTTNVSPRVSAAFDVFFTCSVVRLEDPATGSVLFDVHAV